MSEMKCAACASTENMVIDSRSNEDATWVRRRRRCRACGTRFTTYEVHSQAVESIERCIKEVYDARQKLIDDFSLALPAPPVRLFPRIITIEE